jgi:hypothetical protein
VVGHDTNAFRKSKSRSPSKYGLVQINSTSNTKILSLCEVCNLKSCLKNTEQKKQSQKIEDIKEDDKMGIEQFIKN